MNQILTKIKPNAAQRDKFESVANKVVQTLNKNLKDAHALLGGSGAKDTWLASSHDIDIFVQYDFDKFKNKSMQLSDELEKVLSNVFKKVQIERVHGSRDYFQFEFEGYSIEVVPILEIDDASRAKNITDVSPLHSNWVNKNAKGCKDEIRLAKQFSKAQNVYGAESYISGFSGYILEILVVHYGSFAKLLEAATRWKVGSVIDVEQLYPKKDALFHLNKSKTNSALIIIDPVDKSRNAAAALSVEKYTEFKQAAKKYTKNSSDDFFEETKLTKEVVAKLAGNKPFVMLEFEPIEGKRDVVGMKCRKALEYVVKKLELFEVVSFDWRWQQGSNAVCYIIVKKTMLPEFIERQGPPISLKEHVASFKSKNKDVFERDGHLVARVKVKRRELAQATIHFLESAYVKERVKEARVV